MIWIVFSKRSWECGTSTTSARDCTWSLALAARFSGARFPSAMGKACALSRNTKHHKEKSSNNFQRLKYVWSVLGNVMPSYNQDKNAIALQNAGWL